MIFQRLAACILAAALVIIGTAAPSAHAGDDKPPPPGWVDAQEKDAAARAVYQELQQTAKAGRIFAPQISKEGLTKEAGATSRSGATASRVPDFSTKWLGIVQHTEEAGNWCGPAAFKSWAEYEGHDMPQSDAARLLGTGPPGGAGTPWYRAGQNPMLEMMNYHKIDTYWYTATSLPYSPSASDRTDYTNRLVANTVANRAIVANLQMVDGGPRLNGWPPGPFGHFITVKGYSDFGATTRYVDPAGGLGGIFINVQREDSYNSSEMVTLIGDRGYIW